MTDESFKQLIKESIIAKIILISILLPIITILLLMAIGMIYGLGYIVFKMISTLPM